MLPILFALFWSATALAVPSPRGNEKEKSRGFCLHTPWSRNCWGQYSVDTNYYDVTPHTGNTREYFLTLSEIPCAPDGVQTTCMAFNGQVPGPQITADWGDTIVIHVTNKLKYNGTSVHWHGLRQLNNFMNDGVPGVTQCPIAPGQTQTYTMQATEYGSTWYHSHLSLQYGAGAFGPMIINGPATANYDIDMGMIFLQDWSHTSVFDLWKTTSSFGAPPTLENGLINGKNTYNGKGAKAEFVFLPGLKYRLRLINNAVEGHFQFSIDGHSFTVIANDLVPIVPYKADSILVSIGQRYDIIVQANHLTGNFWMRAGWQTNCNANGNAADITAIVRYNILDRRNPTTTGITPGTNCADEPTASLVPHLALDVSPSNLETVDEQLGFVITPENLFQWTIGNSSLWLDWANPTAEMVKAHNTSYPSPYNTISVDKTVSGDQWAALVIEDKTGIGLDHPIHLHGHDFWVLAQTTAAWDGTQNGWQYKNPPRRDVATLPGGGHLAIAFKLDNPGVWITHCHIAWHASQGLALQFVESAGSIQFPGSTTGILDSTCASWNKYYPGEVYKQDDSGV